MSSNNVITLNKPEKSAISIYAMFVFDTLTP